MQLPWTGRHGQAALGFRRGSESAHVAWPGRVQLKPQAEPVASTVDPGSYWYYESEIFPRCGLGKFVDHAALQKFCECRGGRTALRLAECLRHPLREAGGVLVLQLHDALLPKDRFGTQIESNWVHGTVCSTG